MKCRKLKRKVLFFCILFIAFSSKYINVKAERMWTDGGDIVWTSSGILGSSYKYWTYGYNFTIFDTDSHECLMSLDFFENNNGIVPLDEYSRTDVIREGVSYSTFRMNLDYLDWWFGQMTNRSLKRGNYQIFANPIQAVIHYNFDNDKKDILFTDLRSHEEVFNAGELWIRNNLDDYNVPIEFNSYYVSVKYDDGVESVSGGNRWYSKDSQAVLEAKNKYGYTVDYMRDVDSGEIYYDSKIHWKVNRAKNIYVHSKPNSYILRYDANGGKVSKLSQISRYGYCWGELVTATRDGYSFDGWYTKPTGGELITGKTICQGNIKLYAHWVSLKNIKYQVNYYHQDIGSNNYSLYETEELRGIANTYVVPDRKIYSGFITPQSQGATISHDGSTVINYYYTRVKYNIHFEMCGGINGPKDVTLEYNQKYDLKGLPQRSGYYFLNWNTSKDLSGMTYGNCERISNLTNVNGKTINLYAVWTQRRFTTVKIGSTLHGGTFIKRSKGDEKWYNSTGNWNICDPIPMQYIEQVWSISNDGRVNKTYEKN